MRTRHMAESRPTLLLTRGSGFTAVTSRSTAGQLARTAICVRLIGLSSKCFCRTASHYRNDEVESKTNSRIKEYSCRG